MSDNMKVILIMVGLVVVIFLIRFTLSRIAHKGMDAVSNAIKEKKNKEASGETENLADRYK